MAVRARDIGAVVLRRDDDDGDDDEHVCDSGVNDHSACAHCLVHLAAIRLDASLEANRKHRQAIASHFRTAPALHGFTLESTEPYVYPVPLLLAHMFLSAAMRKVDESDDDESDDDDANGRGSDDESDDDDDAKGRGVSGGSAASVCATDLPCDEADCDVVLGIYFEMVDDESGDCSRALRYYRRAARRGVAIAQFNAARLLFLCTNGTEQATVFRTFDELARRGHIESQHFVASCYEVGYGVHVDVRRYADIIQRLAAFDEFPYVQREYAVCLDEGKGVVRDPVAANALFAHVRCTFKRLAACDDDREAMYYLGEMREEGHGCEHSDVCALRHYEAAAARGYKEARRRLVCARLWGQLGFVGNAVDAVDAMCQLTQLAMRGRISCMNDLAETFDGDNAYVRQDHERAVKWFGRAVNEVERNSLREKPHGSVAYSYSMLAFYYANGYDLRGVRTNTTWAGQLCLEAARRGDADSQFIVGDAYRYGWLGFTANDAQAVRWLSEAAYGGHTDAQLSLACAYNEGMLGLRKSASAAYEWTRRGVAMENEMAFFNMAIFSADGYGVRADPVQARVHLLRSAEKGCDEAHWRLATAYRHGDARCAIERDEVAAHRHTCAAARLGCVASREHLREQCASWTSSLLVVPPMACALNDARSDATRSRSRATLRTLLSRFVGRLNVRARTRERRARRTLGSNGNENDGNNDAHANDDDVLRIELPWVRDAFLFDPSPSPLTMRVLLSRAAVVTRVMRHHATSPLHRSRGVMCDAVFAETLLAFVCSEYVAEADVAVTVPAGALLAVVRCVGTPPTMWCASSAELLHNSMLTHHHWLAASSAELLHNSMLTHHWLATHQ